MSSDRTPAELGADFAAIAAAAARAGAQAGSHVTLLHIGDEDAVVVGGQGGPPASVHRLAIGAARIARDHFRHDPPSAREIERAIDVVEDEIMRIGTPAEADTTLWIASAALQPWRTLAGPRLKIEQVEQWFQRLAAASLGRPGAMQGLPAGREAAAALLVLREFMHHRGHAVITVVDARDAVVGDSPR